MNGTPRGFNRFLLGLLALIFMAFGAGLALVIAVPSIASWWQEFSGPQVQRVSDLAVRTHMNSASGSWIWLIAAAVLLLVVILMISWVASQGKGRTNVLYDYAGSADQDGVAGRVLLSCAVAEQALKRALLERSDLLSVSVTSYDFRGQTSLRVHVLPRKGVAPQQVAGDVGALVESLDALLGAQVPVLLSIGSGARSKFTKAERVR